jgi:hypothetical protein
MSSEQLREYFCPVLNCLRTVEQARQCSDYLHDETCGATSLDSLCEVILAANRHYISKNPCFVFQSIFGKAIAEDSILVAMVEPFFPQLISRYLSQSLPKCTEHLAGTTNLELEQTAATGGGCIGPTQSYPLCIDDFDASIGASLLRPSED